MIETLHGIRASLGKDLINFKRLDIHLELQSLIILLKVTNTLRFEHHLASADNFESWKLRIMMLLKENKIESFVKEEKKEPKDDLEKTPWIENNEKAMKIIVDVI